MTMHSFPLRIYYEDTDAGGVVYYANYLKFAERARTEWLRLLGFEQSQLREEYGVLFVVKRCEVEYHKPGFLDDALRIDTGLHQLGNASITLLQEVVRSADGSVLASLKIVLVCVTAQMKATRLPAAIRRAIAASEREKE